MNKLEQYPLEHHTPNFDVYDKVWIMKDNKPKEMIILAVVMEASLNKQGQDVYYMLVSTLVGAGVGNNCGIRREEKDFFDTKKDLVDSL